MTFRKSFETSDSQVKKYLMSLEGMATHSSILAWRILWTEEPGRIQSMYDKQSDTVEPLSTQHTDPL